MQFIFRQTLKAIGEHLQNPGPDTAQHSHGPKDFCPWSVTSVAPFSHNIPQCPWNPAPGGRGDPEEHDCRGHFRLSLEWGSWESCTPCAEVLASAEMLHWIQPTTNKSDPIIWFQGVSTKLLVPWLPVKETAESWPSWQNLSKELHPTAWHSLI